MAVKKKAMRGHRIAIGDKEYAADKVVPRVVSAGVIAISVECDLLDNVGMMDNIVMTDAALRAVVYVPGMRKIDVIIVSVAVDRRFGEYVVRLDCRANGPITW